MINTFTSADIYQKIENLMNDKGWTIYGLGKRARVSTSTIYNWRDNKSSPNITMLKRLCNALNISAAKLFTNDTDVLSLGTDQKELVRCYDILDDNLQKVTLDLVKEIAKK